MHKSLRINGRYRARTCDLIRVKENPRAFASPNPRCQAAIAGAKSALRRVSRHSATKSATMFCVALHYAGIGGAL